ncbi:unnamed protein product [Urochloa humidicola]
MASAAMELLQGRSFLPCPAGGAGRERGGGPCFAAVGPTRSRRALRSAPPVGALAERVVVTPAPAERAGAAPPEEEEEPARHPRSVAARAVVTVRRRRKEDAKRRVAEQLDAYADRLGRSVLLELVSTEIDPRKGVPKRSKRSKLSGWFEKKDLKAERVVYTAEFTVDASFGEPGAVTVLNRHQREFFVESIVVEGFPSGPAHFTCNSWVQPTRVDRNPRVFFTNRPYLPAETPPGLLELRRQELSVLRGEAGNAAAGDERRLTDRVWEYDVYNDLGNPDKGAEFARPVLGGHQMPYPRRMRTGRPKTFTDERAESRVEYPEPTYVSRDEEFEEGKNEMLSEMALKALLHNFMPLLVSSMSPDIRDFAGFHDVDNLFKEGLRLKQALQDQLFQKIPFVRKIQENSEGLLRYDTPDIIKKDKFAWLRDDEFARQALAGINPVNIERLQAFPPVSKLDPAVYGPPESAITEEHIIGHLDGMSVAEAVEGNRIYMLDYSDIFLPFLERINALDGRKAYGTRTLFFLTAAGTLKPIAIELCLPPMTDGCKRARRVLTPPADATSNWLWQLAKAHVCSNDAGVHQLINHWLRTHASMEPFIIAAHRQLSAMHPIFKLLKPHMRYTLKINAIARQILINGDGVIESAFTPGRYCMEMSAFAYRELWRLDQEGLPPISKRHGRGGPDQAARPPPADRGLPVRHRRPPPLVGHRAVVRRLRGDVLPVRRLRPWRRRAAVLVRRGRAHGSRRQARRAVVAAPVHPRGPRLPAHEAGLAHLGAARGAQLRAVPAGRLHTQPAADDAAAGAMRGRPGVRAPGGRPAPLLPLGAAQSDADNDVHDRHRHALHPLRRRGVPRREARRGMDGRPGRVGGGAGVQGGGARCGGGDRAAERRQGAP